MNVEELRDYCIALPDVTESFPFDEVTLVMKTGGKIFAIIPLDEEKTAITLKCNPDWAIELREHYESVQAAYHMNKKHWNTVWISDEISRQELKSWIDHSYDLVKPKRKQA